MFPKLLLLFIGLPLVEIAILIKLGEVLGFWTALLLVIVTGILGAALARAQGLWIWSQIQQELQMGRMPTEKMLDGLFILIGGIVLLTPGLLTDLFGFAFLVPFTRNLFKDWLHRKFEDMIHSGKTNFTYIIR
ncbi:MAG: membrane protein FxsA [Candidatus Marinimicrobia bacterium]|nr:membrane protein FxsA [Candidatus Neomarinimicrobiota bacterium]